MKLKTGIKCWFILLVLVSKGVIKLRITHSINTLFLEGLPDLLMLGDFNEGPLLHTIRERFSK